jgi:hypothetical protein
VFHFHPLAIEDSLNPQSRVKIEEYTNFLILIVRTIAFVAHTEDPYDIETVNLTCFLGRNFLVTAHGGHTAPIDETREVLEKKPELVSAGPSRLMHAVVDEAVNAYFPILDQLDEFINIQARLRGIGDGSEKRVGTVTAKDDPRWRTFLDQRRDDPFWSVQSMLGPRSPFKHAEHWARDHGCHTMRLEVLSPRSWTHPSKELLREWYTRIGYAPRTREPFEVMHPELMPELATDCDYTVWYKSLVA